nr:hypothetical protein [uncultured Arsenicibacter sp.]
MQRERETVAYWLERFPGLGYSQAQMLIMIDELNAGLPKYLRIAEKEARLEALQQLTSSEVQTKSRKKV